MGQVGSVYIKTRISNAFLDASRSLKTQVDPKEKLGESLPREPITEKASRILDIPFKLLDISCVWLDISCVYQLYIVL